MVWVRNCIQLLMTPNKPTKTFKNKKYYHDYVRQRNKKKTTPSGGCELSKGKWLKNLKLKAQYSSCLDFKWSCPVYYSVNLVCVRVIQQSTFEPEHDNNIYMYKQIDLCAKLRLRSAWSESLLSAWRMAGSVATHTGWRPRLIWVFAERTFYFVGFVMLQFISFTLVSECTYSLQNRKHWIGSKICLQNFSTSFPTKSISHLISVP